MLRVGLNMVLSMNEKYAQHLKIIGDESTSPTINNQIRADKNQLDIMRRSLAEVEAKRKADDAKLKAVQAQCDKLQLEKAELEKQVKAPNINKLTEVNANKELQRAKDYYTNKNVEIDQLI